MLKELEINLKEAEVYFNHGLFLEASELYKEILTCLEEQIEKTTEESEKEWIKKQKAIVSKRLIELKKSVKQGDSKQGDSLETEKSFHEDKQIAYDQAVVLKKLGFYKEAVDEFKKLHASGYKTYECGKHIGQCYTNQGFKLGAINFLEQFISKNPLLPEQETRLRYDLGLLYLDVGASSKALSNFKIIQSLNKDFSNIKKDKVRQPSVSLQKSPRFKEKLKEAFNKTFNKTFKIMQTK